MISPRRQRAKRVKRLARRRPMLPKHAHYIWDEKGIHVAPPLPDHRPLYEAAIDEANRHALAERWKPLTYGEGLAVERGPDGAIVALRSPAV